MMAERSPADVAVTVPRRWARAATAAGVVLAAAGVVGGCGETTAPGPPAPSASAAPVDELEEGELAEGAAAGFGFPFPAKLRIESRSEDRVAAWGPVPFEEVANYVRARVDAAQTSTGPGKTVFDGVKIKAPRPLHDAEKVDDKLGENDHEVLRIDVSRTNRGWTQVVVHRSIRRTAPPGLTEEQRWERLGLTKDGKPADPKKFE